MVRRHITASGVPIQNLKISLEIIAGVLYFKMMCSVELDDSASKEFRSLPLDLKAELFRCFEALEAHGPHDLPPKMARKIDGKLWELRVKGETGIARAMYFTIHPRRAIVVSAFVKKSQKLPENEHAKAVARMKARQVLEMEKQKGTKR